MVCNLCGYLHADLGAGCPVVTNYKGYRLTVTAADRSDSAVAVSVAYAGADVLCTVKSLRAGERWVDAYIRGEQWAVDTIQHAKAG